MELNKILNEVKTEVIRKNCYVPISVSYIDELAKVCDMLVSVQEEILKSCYVSLATKDCFKKFGENSLQQGRVMSVPALRRWLVSVIVALSALAYPQAGLSAPVYVSDEVQAIADSSVSYDEARTRAFAELDRANRVLAEFETDGWFPMDEYAADIEAICKAYLESPHQNSPYTLDGLAGKLGLAFAQLETNAESFGTWMRLARASLPDAQYLPVPRRFVGETSAPLTTPERWSAVDFEVWS